MSTRKDRIYEIRSKERKDSPEWTEKQCPTCGHPFWVINSKAAFIQTCSRACRSPAPIVRILARITKIPGSEPTECWLCDLGRRGNGYASIRVDGSMLMCHRIVFEHFRAPIPVGKILCHKCIGHPACVNPDHVYVGTQKNNMQDVQRQGRRVPRHGELCPTSILTEDQVMEIRSLRSIVTRDAMAEKYGVGRGAIDHALSGVNWSHLPMPTQPNEHGNATLTPEHVAEIRRLSAAGESGRYLAKQFGVSAPAISMIVNRKRWI